MSCPHEVNDGPYILGALAPAERAEFETHLATCPSCRESVAALAVLPGLLGRLDPDRLMPSVASPPEVLPRVLSAARAHRRTQRRRQVLTVAAACVATAVVATMVGLAAQLRSAPGDAVIVTPTWVVYTQMHPASEYAPVVAEIGVRAEPAGTTIAVRCRYHGKSQTGWPIWLVVFPRDENGAEAIGSWAARPGAEVTVTATTHFAPAQIDRVELQGGSNHTTIAWWSP